MGVHSGLYCPDFNPRSPHGERQKRATSANERIEFQSTLPARGATTVEDIRYEICEISIHAPRTGSDFCHWSTDRLVSISIHAPRTGSDKSRRAQSVCQKIFQSTLPARGATVALRQQPCDRLRISIHAPRTGSDQKQAGKANG